MAKRGFKVFDSDMHIMEPPDLWQRYIDPAYRERAPRGITSHNVRDLRLETPGFPFNAGLQSGRNFERNQRLYAGDAQRAWSPEVQLEAMDAEGLDAAVMFPSRGLHALDIPNLEPDFARAIARAYNNWLAEFCAADPQRMYGAGMVSVFDVEDAVEEAHRVVEELGFKAVFIRANIANGRAWHDRYYDPLWDALERLDIPLGLHEASTSRCHQTGEVFDPNFGLRRIFAQPFEQMLAMGQFIGGGVLARHPKLRVAFLEANCSWAPWLIWRMDESQELEGDVFMPELELKPSEYFRRQCVISVEPDETPAVQTIADFGDQCVYSTDYPHGDSRYPKATESFLELPITEDEKRKILWDNCARFYKIGVAATEGLVPR